MRKISCGVPFDHHHLRNLLVPILLSAVAFCGEFAATLQNDFTAATRTGLDLVQAPLHFDRSSWKKLGGAAAATILLFSLDRSVKERFQQQHSSLADQLLSIDGYHGTEYSLYASLAVYGYGLSSGDQRLRQLGLRATEAFVFAGTITNALKLVIGRRRPSAGADPLVFEPFSHGLDNTYLSLPSGHTTAAFAVSTVFAGASDKKSWKAFCYGTAGLVGAARIYHDRHWLSDVFLGGMIGYQVGKFVTQAQPHQPVSGYSCIPLVSPDQVGLMVRF